MIKRSDFLKHLREMIDLYQSKFLNENLDDEVRALSLGKAAAYNATLCFLSNNLIENNEACDICRAYPDNCKDCRL